MRRARRRKAPPLAEAFDDPDAAFAARAARDRARIARLAARVNHAGSGFARPMTEIEDLAHALAGAGGVFGFDAVSGTAARVERLAERWRRAGLRNLSARRRVLLSSAVRDLLDALDTVGG